MTDAPRPWFCPSCADFARSTSVLAANVDPTRCALCGDPLNPAMAAVFDEIKRIPDTPSCPTVLLGCACYRTIEPETAMSREGLLWEALTHEREFGDRHRRERDGPSGPYELVGLGIAEGYGAVANAETLVDAASSVEADLFLYHDADVAFTPNDVASLVERWKQHGPKAIVGTLYPGSRGGENLVGRLTGVELGPQRLEVTPRAVAAAIGPKAAEAESLGFGLVVVPMALVRELRTSRGYAFGECAQGHVSTTPDSELCAAAKERGYVLVADLRAKPRHLQRIWGGA